MSDWSQFKNKTFFSSPGIDDAWGYWYDGINRYLLQRLDIGSGRYEDFADILPSYTGTNFWVFYVNYKLNMQNQCMKPN